MRISIAIGLSLCLAACSAGQLTRKDPIGGTTVGSFGVTEYGTVVHVESVVGEGEETKGGRAAVMFLAGGLVGLAMNPATEDELGTVRAWRYTVRTRSGHTFQSTNHGVFRPGDCVRIGGRAGTSLMRVGKERCSTVPTDTAKGPGERGPGVAELVALQEQILALRTMVEKQGATTLGREELTEEIARLEAERSAMFEDDLPGRLQKAKVAKADRHRFLLAVGIGDYDEVPDVPFADRSVDLFRQAAERLLGVPEENTEFLSEGQATGTRISSRLLRLINRLGPDDTIYFYYAGHGVPSKDGKSSYLLPVDGDAGSYQDDTRMALQRIYERLANSKADRIVSFIDACFSGQTSPDGLVFDGVAPVVLVSESGVPDPKRMTVFAAGKSDQFSNQYAEKGHRLFTYFLIDGLLKGHTEVGDLASYVGEKVDRESRLLGASYTQEPQVYGNTDIDLAR